MRVEEGVGPTVMVATPAAASPFARRLADLCNRIEFNMVVFMGWLFASSCSPPRLSATQLLSATEGQLPSGRDFHPTVGVRSWAHERTRPRVPFPASRRKTLFGETPNTTRGDAYAPQIGRLTICSLQQIRLF